MVCLSVQHERSILIVDCHVKSHIRKKYELIVNVIGLEE